MDHRYDAIYQRGHAGAAPSSRQPVESGEPRQRHRPSVSEVAPLGVDEQPLTETEPAQPAVPSRRNPYLWLLVLAGGILTIGGVVSVYWGGAFMSMRMMTGSVEDQEEAMRLITYGQLLTNLGPFLIALGLGTLVGVLFLSAAQWRKTHPA